MTVPATLAARAAAQGLVRDDDTMSWQNEEGWTVVWPSVSGLTWRFHPEGASAVDTLTYPTEAGALEAGLHWYEAHRPERTPKPSPWAPLAEAVGLLQNAVRRLCQATQYPPVYDGRQAVERALSLLEGLGLPGLSDEERLGLSADTWPPHAVEDGPARRLLVAMLRETPEALADAKLAKWEENTPRRWRLYPVGDRTCAPLALVYPDLPAVSRAWLYAVNGQNAVRVDSPDAAFAAVAAALPDWVVLSPPAKQPAEAQPEATPAAEGEEEPQRCWNCGLVVIPTDSGQCYSCGSYMPEPEPEEPLERNQLPEEPEDRPDGRAALREQGITPPRCMRCFDTGRVSRGSLWGPFEDCPECRVGRAAP